MSVKRFTLLVKLLVPTLTMRSSECSLIMSSSFSRIYSFVPPEKSTIFTFWLTLILFSEIPFIKESLVNTILFFLLEGSAGVLFFCFELELELDFLLAVSNTSSFSVTVFFFFLTNLCY